MPPPPRNPHPPRFDKGPAGAYTMSMAHALTRRALLRGAARASIGGTLAAALTACGHAPASPPEWRNRNPAMAYRRLGRTGLMISEVVCGGDPVRSNNYRHLRLALDMGLNYLDMAPNYGRGDAELAYGALLRETAARDRVFLATKISDYKPLRNGLYLDIFNGLPSEKKRAIAERARQLRAGRAIDKPDYAVDYYPGQVAELDYAYLSAAMMQDYRHRVEGSPYIRRIITQSLDASLKRADVECFDLLLCPHGADSPEELTNTEMHDVLDALRRQGKFRFLGVSAHNDPAGALGAATASRRYDFAMIAYNILTGPYLDDPIRKAAARDVGVIAMKTAHAVATHHKALQPIPQWRIDRINKAVPGDLKPPLKAYLWALQNPAVAAVNSNLWDETHIRENLAVAGKKIPPA